MASRITPDFVTAWIKAMATGSTDPDTIKQEVLQYVSPNYVQDRAGEVSKLDQAIPHLAQLRGKITSLEVEIQKLVVSADGRQFACKHVAFVNGSKSEAVVVMFADVDEEGKIASVYELAK